jgi:uncharacterized protein
MRRSRLNLFGDYARRRWGEAVGKISLHAGVRCPHRQQGGCKYCAADSFTPYYLSAGDAIPEQIRKGKAHLGRLGYRRYLAAFQHETPTAGDAAAWIAKCLIPLRDPACVGLTIGTRPDCLELESLRTFENALEAESGKPVIFELGLQSAREASLMFLNREHGVEDFQRAAAALRSRPRFEIGVHLILGIPGENLEDMRRSLECVAAAGVRHLKLHHLQVIKNTPLCAEYRARPFALPTVQEYLQWLRQLVPWIPPETIIHRLWSTCNARWLEAPHWGLKANQLLDRLERELEAHDIRQGQAGLCVRIT